MNHDGMGHGGMSDNNMNHGEMNDEEMSNNSNHSSMDMDSEWMFAFMPMISLGGDKFTNIINLNRSNSNELVWEESSDNLVVAQNKVISAGAGAGIMAMPPIDIPLFAIKLSLMPYKGGHVYKQMHINSKKDAQEIEEMKVPLSLNDLQKWRIKDQISYSTKGGVMFGAGVGMSILVNAMQMYMAEGSWQTTVRKIDETYVLASIRKNEMKMLSKNISNMLVQISKSKMKNADQYFNFIYDLSNPRGLEAYQRFINGDIIFSQELIKEGSDAVELVKKSNSIIIGKSGKFTAGLPFLFNSQNTRGEMINTSFTYNGYTGSEMKSFMGMYKKTHTTDGVLSNHKNGGVIFMSMVGQPKNTQHFKPNFSSSIKWFYSKQDVKKKTLKRKLRKAAKTLGIDSIKNLQLPVFKELEYIKLELDLALSKVEIQNLLEKRNIYSESIIEARIEDYFSNKQNLKDHCTVDLMLSLCKSRVIKKTKKTLNKIPALLSKMRKSLKNEKLKDFSTEFTNLGRLALTNRFVLAQVMRAAGKKSLKATLKIEGTNIQRYKTTLIGEL
jgi:hypothetical protein